MLHKQFFFTFTWLLFAPFSIFTSQQNYLSYLSLLPNQPLKPIVLAYPYYHMNAQDKAQATLVLEGNYTILDDKSCALVGLLRPCQLFVLQIENNTVVAHIAGQSNFKELLYKIKENFPVIDFSKTQAELFTNKCLNYSLQNLYSPQLNNCTSFKESYQNSNQKKELNFNTNLIHTILNIPVNQINTHVFKSKLEVYDLGLYALAELFVFVKNGSIFNTCPLGENYIQNLPNIDLQMRLTIFKEFQDKKFEENPFNTNCRYTEPPAYSSISFIKI